MSFVGSIHFSSNNAIHSRTPLTYTILRPCILAFHIYQSAHKRAREYADEDEQTAEEDGIPVRRSRRATKGVRFEFWKNERPIYEKV